MQISIHAVGRLKAGPERDLFTRYADRFDKSGRACALGPLHLREINESRAARAAARKDEEAALLLKGADPGTTTLIVLHETGKLLTSRDVADLLSQERDTGTADVAFLIGGPDGHGRAVHDAARSTLSLGRLTLPHGLARIILAEQLYRAVTIISGHPYHRA